LKTPLTIKFKTDAKKLIIEDEAAIRRVVYKNTSEENDSYQVEDAEDGILGFEKKNNDYDLVLAILNAQNGWWSY
jgi:DNA-binding response OmpR family regulator